MASFIVAEGTFFFIKRKQKTYPCLHIYNADLSVMKYIRDILQKEIGHLGRKPIQILEKKEKGNRLRKKKVYLIEISGKRLKTLIEKLPELEYFDKTSKSVRLIKAYEP